MKGPPFGRARTSALPQGTRAGSPLTLREKKIMMEIAAKGLIHTVGYRFIDRTKRVAELHCCMSKLHTLESIEWDAMNRKKGMAPVVGWAFQATWAKA